MTCTICGTNHREPQDHPYTGSVRGAAADHVLSCRDAAYAERDKLVCALSKLFPSSLERHPDTDTTWENDWRWIVFIDLPSGQATWHIHDSELGMFDHLPRFTGRKWDGHTTPEKYERLAALTRQLDEAKAPKDATRETPSTGPKCKKCGHRESVHFGCEIGMFCKECPTEDDVWEHSFEAAP